MGKVKNCGITIFFLISFFITYYIPRIEAQYPYRWIQSIQNTSQLSQHNSYIHSNTNSFAQTIIDAYYLNPSWTSSFLWGSNTNNPFDTYSFLRTNQNLRLKDSSLGFNYYDPLNINSWNQTNNHSYYLQPLWEDPILQGLNNGILQNTSSFLQIEKSIFPWNSLPNSFGIDHYEYPTFEMPLNWTTNLLINNYWRYYSSSFYQDSEFIHLSKGRAFFLEGEYALAIRELKKVTNLPSAKEEIYLMLGISYQSLGNEYLEDAERYLKLAIGFQVYNVKASLQLAKVYYQQSKYMKAIEEYSRIIEKEPENREIVKGLALSYFKANDLTRALRELQKAELMDPNDIEILYTMGIVFEEKHLFVEAIQYFNKVIDISPDSNWASEAIGHLQDIELTGGASTIEDLEEEEILMLIMTAPEPEDMPEIGMVVLLNDIHYEILPDDTLINRIHKLIKIMDERGKDASEIKLSYDSTYRSINLDLARVIKPDGTIIGAGGEDIQEVTPWADFAFYSNIKVLIISMPDITVGSIMEYQVTIEDIPGSKRFDPKEIDAGFTLASTNPVKRARIKVSVPADREFKTTIVNGDPMEPEIVLDGEMKHFTWRLNEVPGMLVEPMMPPVLDISPILYVTSIPSWEIIADWWRDLEFEAIIPDDAIRSKVNQLTNNLDTQKDKARAIFHYVASQIRYVGLEYGKGAVRPHKASQVYENKYGDCKNKTILLITMLREAGIDAYPGLVSTLYHGRAWEEIPRINAFNHVITLCIIDEEWIWMDPTIETSSFGEIPGGIQDRETLVIFDDGYSFTKVPVVAPEKNMDLEITDIQIAEDSSATVSTAITSTGINAIFSRQYFKALDPIYKKQHIETIITGKTTGGSLIDFTLSDVEDLNELYKLEYIYRSPDYIEWAGDIGFIKITSLSPNKAAITKDERVYPVFLENTSVGENFTYINLPEDISVLYMPPPITLEIPQILFISEYTLESHTITYYLRYEIKQRYVPVEDFQEYKKFQEQVDKELKRKIIVEMD